MNRSASERAALENHQHHAVPERRHMAPDGFALVTVHGGDTHQARFGIGGKGIAKSDHRASRHGAGCLSPHTAQRIGISGMGL